MAGRRREVRWSAAAEADLADILDYVAAERPLTAEKLLAQFRKRSSTLHEAADRGRQVPELLRQGISEYRELVISVWRLIYRVHSDTVDVVMLLDARRDVEDLLLLRLTRGNTRKRSKE